MTTTLSPLPVAPPGLSQVTESPLHRSHLLPGLHPAGWAKQPGLSDDGFCDSFASIALSRHLCAGLHCVGGQRSVTVSQRGLGELDLSTHRAWDLSAENLLHRASGPEGLTFFTRPVTDLLPHPVPAVQVATPGARATAWLAHPHTFTILHRHLRGLLGAEVAYLAPTTDVLIAASAGAPELPALQNRLTTTHTPRLPGASLLSAIVHYVRGFPAVAG